MKNTLICISLVFAFLLHCMITTAQCPSASNVTCGMLASQYDHVVIGEISGDSGQFDGCNDGILEIVGPPGTNIGCMLATNAEWAVLIPPGTLIPSSGVFLIACSVDITRTCAGGSSSAGSGLIAGTSTGGGGNAGDFNVALLTDILSNPLLAFDVCNPSNATRYWPSDTGFTLDNATVSDGDQVMIFRPDGTPHDGVFWGRPNITTGGKITVGGASGDEDHVTIQVAAETYTLGDNDGDGIINNNPTNVTGGRGDNLDDNAIQVLPTDDGCPCNSSSSPGTFTMPSLSDSDFWFDINSISETPDGCNSSYARIGTSGGSQDNPSHSDGLIMNATKDAAGQNLDNGGGANMGSTGDPWMPSSYNPSSCATQTQLNAEWGYTDHPTPGQANNDPSFVFYASSTTVCNTSTSVTFTAEVYNYQNVSSGMLSGLPVASSSYVGSYVYDPISNTKQAWTSYIVSGETTTLSYTVASFPSTGQFTFDLVWDDYTYCCGTLGDPHEQTTANECYETYSISIQVTEPLVATQTVIDCTAGDSPEGAINVASYIQGGDDLTYELFDISGGSPRVSIAGPQSSSVFMLNESPTMGDYEVLVVDGSTCSGSVLLTIRDNCERALVCPENFDVSINGNVGPIVSCPGENVRLCFDGDQLPSGGILEWQVSNNSGLSYADIASFAVPETMTTVPLCINEVQADALTESGGQFGEYIELYGLANTDYSGYVVTDGDFTVTFPTGTLSDANGIITISTGNSVADGEIQNPTINVTTCACTTGSSVMSLTNSGEFVALFDPFGSLVMGIIYEEDVNGNNNAPNGQVMTGLPTPGPNMITIPVVPDVDVPPLPWSWIGTDGGEGSSISQSTDCGGSWVDSGGINDDSPGAPNTNAGTGGATAPVGGAGYNSIPANMEFCTQYTISTDLCPSTTLRFRAILDPFDSIDCPDNTDDEIDATSDILVANISCPYASISGSADVCFADQGFVNIPLSISGGVGPNYTISYAIDGLTQASISLTNGDPIVINGPSSKELKIELISITDEGGSLCQGRVNSDAVCINIRPTVTVVIANATQASSCMPCDGSITFDFQSGSNTTSNNYDIEYSINGSSYSLQSVTLPYTLSNLCPASYDILAARDDLACAMNVVSSPQVLTQPTGTAISVNTQPAAVCNDGTISIDLTNIDMTPSYDVLTHRFFAIDPYTIPSSFWSTIEFSTSTVMNITSDQSIYILYTDGNSCTSTDVINMIASAALCSNCPNIGSLTDPSDVCQGSTFDLAISGLSNMAIADNGDADFGIRIVHYGIGNPLPMDVYTGGVTIANINNGSLTGTNPNQSAIANAVGSTLSAGTYQICAILDPLPTDMLCRLSTCIELAVLSKPVAPSVSDLTYCVGTLADPLTATGAGGLLTWYTSDPSIGSPTGSLSAPTPSTANAGMATYYVTEGHNSCESDAADLDVTVREVMSVTAVPQCVSSTNYNLEVCFIIANPGSTGMFEIDVNGTTTSYSYNSHTTGNANEYCVTIPNAGNPIDMTAGIIVRVRDTDTTDGQAPILVDLIVAATSFENGTEAAQYVDVLDGSTDHDLVNNVGQSEVDFTDDGLEMGINATFVSTGSITGLSDGDGVGFTSSTSEVGTFTDGSQGYQMSDTDGTMVLQFDPVDVSICNEVDFSMDIFLASTTWESTDAILVQLQYDDNTSTTLLNTSGMDIDDLSIEGSWLSLSTTISGVNTASLEISFTSNAEAESLYLDNVSFAGKNCSTGAMAAEMCSSTTSYDETSCLVCPSMGAMQLISDICEGSTFDILVDGLDNFASTDNLENDFGIEFVVFDSNPSDVYSGGTQLGVVSFSDFMGTDPNQSATSISVANSLQFGIYTICARLESLPSLNTCRPQACTTLRIQQNPTIGTEADIIVCENDDTTITPSTGSVDIFVNANDLLLSQYIEGSGDNKCIELFNGTGSDINLSVYNIDLYSNGNPFISSSFTLPNVVLATGQVYVICNGNADPALIAVSDLTNDNTINFNGDDVIAISKSGMVIDAIGEIGLDPGTSWDLSGVSTQNNTLVLNANVAIGSDGTTTPFDPSLNYTSIGNDNFTGLGSHDYEGTMANATLYNFYSDASKTMLLAANASSYNPMTTLADSPESIFVSPIYSGTSCEGDLVEVAVNVIAPPSMTDPSDQVVCNGNMTQTVDFTSTTPNVSYTWVNNNTSIGLAASGTGNIASFNAVNTTALDALATITVTPTLTTDGIACTGLTQSFTIRVYASPTVNRPSDQILCSGSMTADINFAGSAGASFIWENDNPSIGLTASGTGDIPSFTVTNATINPIIANITVRSTVTNNGTTCTGQGETFQIQVEPLPLITAQPTNTIACEDGNASISISAQNTSGNPLQFELQFLSNGSFNTIETNTQNIDGVENVSFIIAAVDMSNAGMYRVVVTNINTPNEDCSITSNIFELTVNAGGVLTCNDQVNYSVSDGCLLDLSPQHYLEGQLGAAAFASDIYTVSFTDDAGVMIANNSHISSYIGQCLSYIVRNTCDENVCWGNVCVEDNLAPIITQCACPIGGDPISGYAEECRAKCYTIDFPSDAFPLPVVSDNCSSVSMVYQDIVLESSSCATQLIQRTWTITDEQNNISENCIQEFLFERIDLNTDVGLDISDPAIHIGLPPARLDLPCGTGTSPEEVSAYFDNPLTVDDLNGCNGVAASLVEKNEGIAFAYPYYQALACANSSPFSSVRLYDQALNSNVCNIVATYNDVIFELCGSACSSNSKVVRTWSLLDWCTNTSMTHLQVINAADTEAPIISAFSGTTSFSSEVQTCMYSGSLPLPIAEDNCVETDSLRYKIKNTEDLQFSPQQGDANYPLLIGQAYQVIGAGIGMHTIQYEVSDCCGNVSFQDVEISIHDVVAPFSAVKQNLVLGLISSGTTAEGVARLYATDLDAGSFDNCTDIKLEIRRPDYGCRDMNSGNGTFNNDAHPGDGSNNPNSSFYDFDEGLFVSFCCEDLDQIDNNGIAYGIVQVEVRVWDDGNMSGVAGDRAIRLNDDFDTNDPGESDNYNTTWAEVRIEDKGSLTFICPDDITIDCNSDATDIAVTGSAAVYSACNTFIPTYSDIESLSCGAGTIIRTWSYEDLSCTQKITKNRGLAWDAYGANGTYDNGVGDDNVQWPADIVLNCMDSVVDSGQVTWTDGLCDQIAVSQVTEEFINPTDACYLKRVQWTVIDWCQYMPNDPLWTGGGIWTHTQRIEVIDQSVPSIGSCEVLTVEYNEECEVSDIILRNVAIDTLGCDNNKLFWQISVDVDGDADIDFEYESSISEVSDFDTDSDMDGILDRYVSATESQEQVIIILPQYLLSDSGEYKVIWEVRDVCGNSSSCTTTISLKDNKSPTPYCLNLSSAVMPSNGELIVWASDFNVGSFDNCTAQADLRFSFSADVMDTSKIFSSEDCGVEQIEIYVHDSAGNKDFCVVNLNISGATCQEDMGPMIGGSIRTENGIPVSSLDIVISSEMIRLDTILSTDDDGAYLFDNGVEGGQYIMEANNSDHYLEGVSTLDLVIMHRHILGLEKLKSPYQHIAADINDNGKISSLDLIQLRKLILGIYDELPDNTSWIGVDAHASVSIDPLGYQESIHIDRLSEDMKIQDFIAVKIGDVNGSIENIIQPENLESRALSNLEFQIKDQTIARHEMIQVDFTSSDFNDVLGFQFTLGTEGLEYVSTQSGVLKIENQSVAKLSDDIITISWYDVQGLSVADTDILFSILFKANRNGRLSHMIDLNSLITPSEAYRSSDMDIDRATLKIVPKEEMHYKLYQNIPNPFVDRTIIGFELPQSCNATITIYDIMGSVIKVVDDHFDEGYNQVFIDEADLDIYGVFYYEIRSGTYSETKKMVRID